MTSDLELHEKAGTPLACVSMCEGVPSQTTAQPTRIEWPVRTVQAAAHARPARLVRLACAAAICAALAILPGCSTEQASQIASNAAQAIPSSATGTASDNAAGDSVTDASSESSQPEQDGQPEQDSQSPQDASSAQGSLSIEDAAQLHIDSAYVAAAQAPAYSGEPFVLLDDNEPTFTSDEATTDSFEYYGPLDSLGRCTVAYACLGPETLATEERGNISEIHPSGWQPGSYDFVDGERLYNRCHLIAHQLSGENANERNLITGTRYMNTEGMLSFEEMVGDYIRQTGNHVLYCVVPVFEGDELVARGVRMEARSMEDGGAGINYNLYAYNVQPGVEIDYETGHNWLADDASSQTSGAGGQNGNSGDNYDYWEWATGGSDSTGNGTGAAAGSSDVAAGEQGSQTPAEAQDYVLNTSSRKFHYPWCDSVEDISPENREEIHESRDTLVAWGYEPCGGCNP